MEDIGKILKVEYMQVFNRYKNPTPYDVSYTNKLFTKPGGVEKKLMEEAFEVAMASIGKEGTKRQISELADLMYVTIAYMVQNGILLEQLAQEMAKRQK